MTSQDNGFGFKPKHGTSMCIYALREIVNLYRAKTEPPLMYFINDSKACSSVKYRKFFDNLKKTRVCKKCYLDL